MYSANNYPNLMYNSVYVYFNNINKNSIYKIQKKKFSKIISTEKVQTATEKNGFVWWPIVK